jgi:hypothetical protein
VTRDANQLAYLLLSWHICGKCFVQGGSDLHEAMLLMRAAGIPCDRMHPDHDWRFPEYRKELVP